MRLNYSEYLGNNLRLLRHYFGYTTKELIGQIAVSKSAYSKWERGESGISDEHIQQIASIYGITPNELIHKTQDELLRHILPPPPHKRGNLRWSEMNEREQNEETKYLCHRH